MDFGQDHVRGRPIRGQEVRKEDEVRVMPGGYWHQGIPVELGCYLTLVILLQVYIVLNSRTIQGLYLGWVDFFTTPSLNFIDFSD